MKIQNQLLAFSLATVMVVGVVAAGCKKTDSDSKVESDVKTTAQDTATAAKDVWNDGKTRTVEFATNATAAVKAGAHKAGGVATNLAAVVKKVTTNTLSGTKSVTTNVVNKLDNLIH